MLKFAVAEILSAHPSTHGRSTLLSRTAHRADFSHHPVRPGFLYVRSRAISSRCNDNFDEFPAEEIEKSWRTFVGKPVFVNHVNHDTQRARGVIIDAALHRDRNPDATPDTWVEVLMEVDGARFPKLAQAIVEGKVYETSMGCDVDYSLCSACGNKATRPEEYCRHIPASKGTLYATTDRKTGARRTSPIREICYGLKFFENSLLVEAPADPTAQLLNIDATGLGKTAAGRRPVCTDCGKRAAARGEDLCKYCDAKEYAHWYGREYLEGKNLHRMDWQPHIPGNIRPKVHNGEPSVHDGKGSLIWNGVCRDCGATTSVGLGGSSSGPHAPLGAPVARDTICAANDPARTQDERDFTRNNHQTVIQGRTDQISRGISDAVSDYSHATEDNLRRDIHDRTGLDTAPYTPPQRGTQHLNSATATDTGLNAEAAWGGDGSMQPNIRDRIPHIPSRTVRSPHAEPGHDDPVTQEENTRVYPPSGHAGLDSLVDAISRPRHEHDFPEGVAGASQKMPADYMTHLPHAQRFLRYKWENANRLEIGRDDSDEPTLRRNKSDRPRAWVRDRWEQAAGTPLACNHPKCPPWECHINPLNRCDVCGKLHNPLHNLLDHGIGAARIDCDDAPGHHAACCPNLPGKTARYADTGPQCSRCHHVAGTGPGCPKCDTTKLLHGAIGDLDLGADGHDVTWQYRDAGPTVHGTCRNCGRTTEPGAPGMHGDNTAAPAAHSSPCPAPQDRYSPQAADRLTHAVDYLPEPLTPQRLSTRTAAIVSHSDAWGQIHQNLGEIHRGISIHLTPEDHSLVHDRARPVAERAAHLMKVLGHNQWHGPTRIGAIGQHWSSDHSVGEDFATGGGCHGCPWPGDKNYLGDGKPAPGTAIIFHAHKPDLHDIDKTPSQEHGDVFEHNHLEAEVPLRPGAHINLRGISWKPLRHEKWTSYDDPDSEEWAHEPHELWDHHNFSGSGLHAVGSYALTSTFDGDTDDYTTCDQGHEHWGTAGAAGMLIHHDGHVLLGRRADWVQHGGTWGTPGGALHEGEGPEQGAHREATEELGGLPALHHTHTHHDDHGGWKYSTVIAEADHRFHPEGGDGETDEFAWVHPSDFHQYDLHPGFAASWPKIAPHVRGGAPKTAARGNWWDAYSTQASRRNTVADQGEHHQAARHTASGDDAAPQHDYRFLHTAPDATGVPLHKLLHPSSKQTLRSFENSSPADEETGNAVEAANGRPRARIKIYRAVPSHITTINPGDWVALSSGFARNFAEGRKDHHVIATTAEARHIHTDGNDASEWGYNGPAKNGKIHWKRPVRPVTPDYAGGAVQLSADDHDFIHGTAPVAERAHRLMQAIPRWSKDTGPYSTGAIHRNKGSYTNDRSDAHSDAQDNADNLSATGHPATLFMLHAPQNSRAVTGVSFAQHTPPETPLSAYTHHTWGPDQVDEATGMRHAAALTTEAASASCPHCGEPSHGGHCTMGRVRTTDWSAVPHFDEIHRGFPVLLGAEDHAAVHDPERSPAERGIHLLSILRDHSDALGSHWSTDAHFAHDTAQEGYGNDLSSGYEDDEQPHDTHVVVHASFPEHHHIETDIDNLRDGGVFGWNHRTPGDYPAEHEVPLKYNSPVHVSGVSFKHADDDRWTHARFGDDITHTALLQHHSGKLAAGPRHENPADHPFFKTHPVSAAHVVAHWGHATDEEKAQGKRWYADAHLLAKALGDTYAKGDVGKAAGVISAYSPRQNWAANMHNAARSLAEGRALGLGEGMSIMGQHQKSAQRIIDGEHYNTVLKAPKTNAFAALIHHGGIDPDTKKPMKHVVIDRHALSVAAGKRLSEDDVSGFPSSIPHYYNHVAKTYTDAADAISNTEGHSVAPHEVQAVTWMVRIRKNREEDRTARGGGGKGRVKNQDNNATKWRDTHRQILPGGAGDDNMHMSSRTGARRRVEGMGDGDYRMQHQPDADFGAPLHDPTGTFPNDVYEHPDWYTGAPDGEMVRSLHRAKGEPEKKIRIYRAVPQGVQHINTGDWVTLSKEYAKQHVQSNVPGGHVLRIDAPAKHIISGGDDLQEWGYHGPTRIGMSSWAPKGYKHRYPGQTDPKTAEGTRTGALDSVQAMADGSYRMMHQAPDEESGEPLHEVFGEHPDEPHTVYRAVPRHIHEINKGDWVTSHAEYAHQHALELEPGRRHGHVLQAQVPLRHLYTDHNDENEIGYTGPDLHNVDTHEHPDFPETMHSDEDEEENEEPPHYAGGAVHLSPQDHHFVHDPNRPVAERAHRLMHALPNKYDAPYSSMGHSTGYWDEDTDMAQIDAEERAEKLGGTGSHPATQFVLHSPLRADVTTGVSWAEHGPEKYYHSDFTHHRWPASDIDPDSGLRKHAYGETKAPAQIDTLREDECPVCGNTEGWDGIDCPVCQWSKPPDIFMDPDTSVARTMDLRGVGEDAAQQALQQGADAVPAGVDQAGQLPVDGDPAQGPPPGGPGGEMEDPQDATADGEVRTLDGGVPDGGEAAAPQQELSPAQMPPNAQDVLSCPACGFQTPAGPPLSSVTEDPSAPASAGPVAGDVCPNCGKATLLSAAEEAGLTAPPEVAAIDPQAADAQPDPGLQQESEPQAPQEAGMGDEQSEDGQDEPPEPEGKGKSKSPAVKRVSRRGQGGKTRR